MHLLRNMQKGIRNKNGIDLTRRCEAGRLASTTTIASVAFIAGITVIASSCRANASQDPEIVLSYADNQTADYPTTQGAMYFAEQVEKETNGRIRIRVYSNAELGDEISVAEQMTFGGIDMARISLSTLTDYSAESAALIMPYLYKDSDHMWRVLDGEIGQEVMDSFEGTGLVPLSWYDAGVRNFYMKEEMRTPDEFVGKKIRVQPTDLMSDMVRLLGATPMPLNYSEVYAALEKGTVDGAENNWSSYAAMKHYQVAPYFILDEHIRIPELQIISESTMKKLSEEDQAIIRECAQASAVYERELWIVHTEQARNEALEEGCTEIILTDEEKQLFRDAVRPLYEDYVGSYMNLIERIEQEGNSNEG